MRNTVYLLFILFITISFSLKGQDNVKYSYSSNTVEAIEELKANISHSDKLKKAIKMAEDMDLNGIHLVSTKQYQECINAIGDKPSIKNQEAYSIWKKKTVNFKETHVSVSDFISRL